MRVINNVSLLILFLLVAFGCKKKTDGKGPEVDWQLPQQFAAISAVDTFVVKAVVSDPDGVKRVSVRLTDETGAYFAGMGDEFPDQTEFHLNKGFELNRPDLLTGNYFLHLEAFDEDNRTSIFRPITLQPIPWELLATAIAFGSAGNSTLAVSTNAGDPWQTVASATGDVLSIKSMHLEKRILVTTGATGKVMAFQHPEFSLQWTFEIPNNTSLRKIEASDVNPVTSEIIVADTDQQFYLMDRNGSTILIFSTDLLQHQARELLLTSDRIFSVERKMDGSSQSFSEYFKVSGALKHRVYFPGQVIKMFEEKNDNNNQVVVFLMHDGMPKMRIYNRNSAAFSEPLTLPSGQLNGVCRMGVHKYLIQIDGTIYHYNGSGSLQIYYNGGTFNDLIYDPVNHLILGLGDQVIHYLNLQGGALQTVGTVEVPGALNTAGLLLNR